MPGTNQAKKKITNPITSKDCWRSPFLFAANTETKRGNDKQNKKILYNHHTPQRVISQDPAARKTIR